MRYKGDRETIRKIKQILSTIKEPTTGLDLITGEFIDEIEIDFTRIIIHIKDLYPMAYHPFNLFLASYITNTLAKKIVESLNKAGFTEVLVVGGKREEKIL